MARPGPDPASPNWPSESWELQWLGGLINAQLNLMAGDAQLNLIIDLLQQSLQRNVETDRRVSYGGPGVFINNPMITITIRISSPGLIFNPTIIDYRLDHAAITDYD